MSYSKRKLPNNENSNVSVKELSSVEKDVSKGRYKTKWKVEMILDIEMYLAWSITFHKAEKALYSGRSIELLQL